MFTFIHTVQSVGAYICMYICIVYNAVLYMHRRNKVLLSGPQNNHLNYSMLSVTLQKNILHAHAFLKMKSLRITVVFFLDDTRHELSKLQLCFFLVSVSFTGLTSDQNVCL